MTPDAKPPRKPTTLVLLLREDQILLATKKRGFGAGKWNGPGGKVEAGETPEQAAIRECQEEVSVTPRHLRKIGELDFYLTEDPGFNHYMYIYIVREWDGEPAETEEMRPQWFSIDQIPYDYMWGDDRVWLPKALASQPFRGSFTIGPDNDIVKSELHDATYA